MLAPPDPILRGFYRHCRRIHRRHDPTYYWATRRLPAEVRPAVHAVYAFVRLIDEIVDAPQRLPDPAARRAALDSWELMLANALRGDGAQAHPVVAALADAGRRHRLPLGELRLYFDSMRKDSEPVRVQTWDELERYMQGSAGSVGRILAALLGVPAERRSEFASLALAFQLTNFVRDVREDWDLDRVYLPAEDLEYFGVSVDQIERRELTPGFRRVVALEVERARLLFRASAPAADSVAPGVRRGMHLARSVYLGVLDRTERLDFDVLRGRPSLSPWEMAQAVAGALRSRAPRSAAPSAPRSTENRPTSSYAARVSRVWRPPASWRGVGQTCCSWTATRWASALPPPAPRRAHGSRRWAWLARSGRTSPA